jgi:hypothetical protein
VVKLNLLTPGLNANLRVATSIVYLRGSTVKPVLRGVVAGIDKYKRRARNATCAMDSWKKDAPATIAAGNARSRKRIDGYTGFQRSSVTVSTRGISPRKYAPATIDPGV